jgi:hypothetical protein
MYVRNNRLERNSLSLVEDNRTPAGFLGLFEVDVMSGLWAGLPENHTSILVKDKGNVTFPQCPDRLCGSCSFLSSKWNNFPGDKAAWARGYPLTSV